MKKLLTSLIFCTFQLVYFAQLNFYQETCRCGVTGSGFSTGLGSGSGSFDIFIEPASIIKKAFLFATRNGSALPTEISVNGIQYLFNLQNQVSNQFKLFGNPDADTISVHAIDVSGAINPNVTTYNIDIPFQNSCSGCSYNNIYLYVLYENLNLNFNTSSLIILNEQNETEIVNYNVTNLNPKVINSPFSFAVYTDRLTNETNDGANLSFFNGTINSVGVMQGNDSNSLGFYGAGVKGFFYFQNNLLYGLGDDSADNLVGGADGLVNCSSYMLSNSSLEWSLRWLVPSQTGRNNIYSGFFLAYSTPCDTFTVSVTRDTTICKGQNLQLSASGGQQYLWQSSSTAALGELSCTDCPNPIFSGDSSRLFTVQIWNNDSCSVVRPVKVNVKENPKFSSINLVPTLCGLETGTLKAVALNTSVLPISYALDNNAYDFSSTFTSSVYSALDAGYYTIHLKDGTGCVSDSTVFVGVNNPTLALFSANPQTGAAPLFVSLENTSVSATDYTWFLNDVVQSANFSSFLADTSGIYEIELIAWQNDVSCADTFTVFVSVYDSLLLQIPNIFTPNADGINDIFGIKSNIPISVKYEIYNRWGEVITYGTKEWSSSIIEEFYELWGGYVMRPFFSLASDGVYFYKMEVSAFDKNLNPTILDLFPIKKEGFFHLEK